MAIVVEESGGRKSNVLGMAAWIIFLVIVAGAVYYIFFAKPELVILPASGTLSAIVPVTQSSENPSSVVQSASFQALHSTIALPEPQGPAAVGRSNPFVAP